MAGEVPGFRNSDAAGFVSLPQRPLHWLTPILVASVAAIGVTTLLGWTFGLSSLTSWVAGSSAQKPVTALAFLALAVALISINEGQAEWQRPLGWAVAAVAALSLIASFTGIDAWIASRHGLPETGSVDWLMRPATATTLMSAGAAVGWLGHNRYVWVVPALAIIVGLLGPFEFILLLLAGQDLQLGAALGSVSLPTAIASFLVATTLLLHRPFDLADLARQSGVSLGIREWLTAFGVMVVLPVILFAGLAAKLVATFERTATLVQLERRTEAAANKVERYLQSLWELAVTLAESPAAQTGDLLAFYGFAKRAMEAGKVGRAVVIADPTGQMLLNTRRPLGELLPTAGDKRGHGEAVAQKAPHIGNLFLGAVSRTHVFTVWVPVVREGQLTAVVGVTVEPQDLTAALREENLPQDWIGAVIDREGIIVARTQAAETFVGRQASSELRASIANGQSGIFPSITATGLPVSTSIKNLQNSGWTLAVGVPQSVIDAPARASRNFMLGLGLASLLTAGFLAFVLGRQMSEHISSVAAAAIAVGEGRQPPQLSSSIREVDAVSNALVAARSLIDEREVALRQSEGRLRLSNEAAGIGTFDIDVTTAVARYSPELATMLGVPGAREAKVEAALARVHREDFNNVRSQYDAALDPAGDGRLRMEFRFVRPGGEIRWMWFNAQVIFGGAHSGRTPSSIVGACVDITERKRAEERQEMLVRELDHRVKNVLELVQTIALRTLEDASTLDEYIEAFLGRLDALSEAHSAMSRGGWVGGDLAKLVHQELKPYSTATNATVEGPETLLTPLATQSLVLVLHELATNAAKYGAFSPNVPNGHVSVTWRIHAGAKPHLAIDWRESRPSADLPAPNKASHQGGYGSSVIREMVPYDLPGSTVNYRLEPAGVDCHIEMPLTVSVVANA